MDLKEYKERLVQQDQKEVKVVRDRKEKPVLRVSIFKRFKNSTI